MNSTRPLLAPLFLLVAALPGAGCHQNDMCDCPNCTPAVELDLVDEATGEAVPGATVTGTDDVQCDGVATCSFGSVPGTYTVQVAAPGYVSKSVTVVIAAGNLDADCCACAVAHVQQAVKLTKA